MAERRSSPVLIEAAIEEFHQAIHMAQKVLIEQMYQIAPDCSVISPESDQDLDKLELAICKLDEAKAALQGITLGEPATTEPHSPWERTVAASTKSVLECLFGSICLSFLGYSLLTSFTFSEQVWWMFPLLAVLCMVLLLVMGRVTIWSMNKKIGSTKGNLSDLLCTTCFARKSALKETLIGKGEDR